MCDYWNNGKRYSQSTDPIRLEPADFFFVMFRVEDKQITRIRTYSANCPLDAGGKAVHWFNNVPVNDSVNYMKTFMGPTATRKIDGLGRHRARAHRRPAAAQRADGPGA